MWEGVVKFQVLLMTRRDPGALGEKRHHQDSQTAVEAWSGNQVSELSAFGGQTHGIHVFWELVRTQPRAGAEVLGAGP